MLIITSPAKLMRVSHHSKELSPTQPVFIKEAEKIHKVLKNKSPKELQELMKISSKLADENWQRNQEWNSKPEKEKSSSAILAFTGEVYRGLDADSLQKKELEYLQNHYRMLSGLYGLLKPSDVIMLYRMEMGKPLKVNNQNNLYEFWQEKITEEINSIEQSVVLNLASNEYQKVIDRKKLKAKIYDVNFLQLKDNKLKNIVVYTKHARGLLTRFCALNNIKEIKDIIKFDMEGYLYSPEHSDDKQYTFIR